MKYDGNVFELSVYACKNNSTVGQTNKETIEMQKRL